jgi:hypothetical protein
MPYTLRPKISLLAPGFPLFVPVVLPGSKSTWKPWGRSAPPILSLRGPESKSYFERRNAPGPCDRPETHRTLRPAQLVPEA